MHLGRRDSVFIAVGAAMIDYDSVSICPDKDLYRRTDAFMVSEDGYMV